MLKSWRIQNFKSFGEQPDISLSGINVLAGANSSGKSSIIQSILLLKQTIQYGSENRSIALNGPLLRLGAFDDILNHQCEHGAVEIGFEIRLDDSDINSRPVSPWIRTLTQRSTLDPAKTRSIVFLARWQKRENLDAPQTFDLPTKQRLTPDLTYLSLKTERENKGEKMSSETVFKRVRPKLSETEDQLASDFQVETDKVSLNELMRARPQGTVWGGFTSYFLPQFIAIRFNHAVKKASEIAEQICDVRNSLFIGFAPKDDVPDEVIDLIDEWLVGRGKAVLPRDQGRVSITTANKTIADAGPQAPGFFRAIQSPPSQEEKEYSSSLANLQARISTKLLLSRPTDFRIELDIPRVNTEATSFIREFFKQGVRYLGPLRDSPRPVYQVEALESTTDVGYRGEHTAAILDLNSQKQISYTPPPVASELGQRGFATLHDAAVEWLQYLGVASEVVTHDVGVFGHQLKVTTDGKGNLHDLTNVGVGVSQVLPIVVMALLASPGSLLIFEQPELHLHPSVQARLADFFISLALDRKQLLLETHSEYLIDRLRLRIAEAPNDKLRNLTNILFSEKAAGQSSLTSVEVNEYGAISNWPRDFFDQSQQDVGAILRAATEKRKSHKAN